MRVRRQQAGTALLFTPHVVAVAFAVSGCTALPDAALICFTLFAMACFAAGVYLMVHEVQE